MSSQEFYVMKHKCSIYDILRVCGLSKNEVGSFYSTLLHYEKTRGTLDLVRHLKQRLKGLLQPETSVFHVNKDGLWRGTWRIISRHATKDRHGLRSMCRVLRLGGLFEAPHPTIKDYIALEKDIAGNPENDNLILYYQLSAKAQAFSESLKELENTEYQYPLSSSVVPLSRSQAVPEVLVTPAQHHKCLDNCPDLVCTFYQLFEKIVGPTLKDSSYYKNITEEKSYVHDVVGSITLLTKDRGMKMRAVCNPFRILQLALEPLADTMYMYLRRYRTCFVFDQDAGAEWVSDRLAKGVSLSSIDLSSATDNIPLKPQSVLAKQLFPWLSQEIDFFSRISRSYWWSPYDGVDLQYTRGQSMGLKGSFPLFTIWLLHVCEHATGGREAYALVGDDMVVEASYEERVLTTLQKYGVPVNYGKSLFNSNIAEFVGRLLDKRGSLRVFKASPMNLIRDPLGLIRQYGERAFNKTSLKHKISFKRRVHLIQFIELKRCQLLCALVALHGKTSRERKLLQQGTVEKYAKGGVPDHIKDEWLGALDRKQWKRCKVLLSIRKSNIMEEIGKWPTRPIYLVQGWHFKTNPDWALELMAVSDELLAKLEPGPRKYEPERIALRQYLLEELKQAQNVLSVEPPDIEMALQRAVERKTKSPEKIEKEYIRSQKTPIAYINRFIRVYARVKERLNQSHSMSEDA